MTIFPGGIFLRCRVSFLSRLVLVILASSLCFSSLALDISEFKNASKLMPGSSPEERPGVSENRPDNSIDPQTYYIGSGDDFLISVIESPSIRYTGMVNENNDVYIPELGIVKIGKQPLVLAKKIIADFVGSKLRNRNEVYVSLVRIKTVNVNVTGAVQNAGTYKALGSFRLLDVIKTANGGTLPLTNGINVREVICASGDSTKRYDLFKFLYKSDLLQNPYVYGGDNVSLVSVTRFVYLAGAVKNITPGNIPIKQDEQICDFLSFFTFDAAADSDRIVVQRVDAVDGKPISKIISLKQPGDFPLKDRDIVIVSQKKNYPEIFAVSASGEVARPGIYPIIKNVTRAADIVDLAGGVTSPDLIDRAYVIRRKKMLSDEAKRNLTAVKPVMSGNLADNSVRPEVNSAMFRMNTSNDFVALRLSDHKDGIFLEQGDEIIVPKKEYYVYVSGSVRAPGAYEYAEGKDKLYYINKAGGYSSRADRSNVSVVAYFGEVQQIKDNNVIEAGDIVVVPDSQQYKFLSVVLIPIISAAAATVATILAIATTLRR
jgi:protein involved in polysaccharide export with SLBB domain